MRVAAVPAGHPYVRSVSAGPGVRLLPDPVPPGAEPGRWWPPVVLDADWVRAHARDADVLHVHFGTEHVGPEELGRVLDAAREVGWPVVTTVHDLEHPQLVDQAPHLRVLDVLVTRADAVLTLTPGAAAEVRARWGRAAEVVGHPRLLGDDDVAAALAGTPSPAALVVGLHLKDLRPNVDGPAAARRLLAALTLLRAEGLAVRGEVHLQHRVRDEAARARVRELCTGAAADAAGLVLREGGRPDDRALVQRLAALDVCVLPYTHGTHSGWLELCWDLGVAVAAPRVGYYAQQHADGGVVTFDTPDDDGTALAGALRALVAHPDATRPGTPERADRVRGRLAARRASDAVVATQHADLYRRLVAAVRA